ncbi:hypothetical protein E5F05_13840 [Deinococcus metallilatus]|uniref:DUF2259 domain-containing protein n=1 Tax=Deinococcus metallilatus TaxID=1211322 RepID=A0AAE5YSK8_9DEIO|nr:hypothetical protein [Deinococcus metallilatus]MBB5294149.1 hypothetical protein [Deinococcus metallilatus]QBY08931.1 hypothetical protein E5F05_13840 [Deinococcus metallilatus]RXJ10075.1 hypothetical protein ERJ73_12670 [Deinococcus metallilatus]TLK27988.1 hypothetical protein FCS05_08710 [Deinococcus metallilatus]GMA16514.1 hypothetical protein GCM10025871_28450 [Deinococcus metallilatus]
MPRFLPPLLTLLIAGSALAYVPALNASLLQSAFDEGQRLAENRDSGYPLKPYTLYVVADTLKLEPQNGAVDAVTIGTPYERTRYESFLSKYGEDPITPQQARQRAELPDYGVDFIVFAHGLKPEDQNFLNRFGPARLRLGGVTLRPVATTKSGASISSYPRTVGEPGLRFTGTVTYRFQLPKNLTAAKGTLSFTDPSGKAFNIPVNLTLYR